MIARCSGVSTDFTNIQKGEFLWMQGHAGVYIGDGKVVECTPAWNNNVQITWLGNLPQYKQGNNRVWTKHGKLPWINYGANSSTPTPSANIPTSNENYIWSALLSAIKNEYGVAGLMGNLQAESGLSSINVQNSYEKKLGMNDTQYTQATDNGTYGNFIHDAAGYGLAQWTYWSRKQNLLNFAKSSNRSVGDLTMQIEFLLFELQNGYKSVWNGLVNATSVRGASDVVLTQFERPADQSEGAKQKRASYGQVFYDKYAGGKTPSTPTPTPVPTPSPAPNTYLIKVPDGFIFDAPPTKPLNAGIYTILEEKNGFGRLKSGAGWIDLSKGTKQ